MLIGEDEKLFIDNSPTDINAFAFLYNLQQPTKKIDSPDYFELLKVLQIKEEQVITSNAKTSIRKSSPKTATKRKKIVKKSQKQSFKSPQNKTTRSSNRPAERYSPKTKAVVTKKKRKVSKLRTNQVYRRKNNGNLTTSEEKLLQSMYTKGPAEFGSVENLQKKNTKLQPRKVKQFLETKNARTKYKGFRKSFARLKVIAYDLDEIWSLDLAHVDKLSKQNAGIKYLLIAVDCLSRYLLVETLKSKYATTTAEAFKRMIKHKQPKKVWVDAGTEFKGNFKTLCQRRNIKIYQTFSEKKSAFAERNIRSLKNIIYKYLEEKWTYSYISVDGNRNHQRSIPSGAVSKPYKGETVLINTGSYKNLEHLIKAIKTATGLTKFSHQYNKITGVLVLFFGKNERITFPDDEIPSTLGFEGIKDGSGTHIGYKMLPLTI